MSPRPVIRWFLLALLASATLVGLWRASLAQLGERVEPQVNEELTQTLGGEERYLTFLSTDKPLYKPGETLYARAVVLHHRSHEPLAEDQQLAGTIEILGPKGDVIAGGTADMQDSVLSFSWVVPEEMAGGEYKIKLSQAMAGHAPAERTFDIRSYNPPRLRTQIEFMREGYGPGDEVAATLEVTRAEGGIPAGAAVTVVARVDGMEVYRGESQVDTEGHAATRFALPPQIPRGEGTLAMIVEDGGVVETASKTIPILLQTVDLTMYPEGGQLVAGLPARVYLQAFTPFGKPADLAGVIVDDEGNEVAEFRSEHEGRGRFAFTPEAGHEYSLQITQPAGIETTFPLPATQESGGVIASETDITSADEAVALSVAASEAGEYIVTLRHRESEVARHRVELAAGQPAELELNPGEVDGVLIATLWDAEEKPLAERLVFRQPEAGLNVEITANSSQYVPGGEATLTIQTTDAAGEPVSAVVGLTVTDDSVLEMLETRDQAPRLPVMVFLEPEVEELADAAVYLDPNNDEAPRAVDLLLGTQGWRRFAFVDINQFMAEHGDDARRALGLRIATVRDVRRMMRADDRAFAGPVPEAAAANGAIELFEAVPEMMELEAEMVMDDAEADGAAPPADPGAGPVPAPQPPMAQDEAANFEEIPAARPAPPLDQQGQSAQRERQELRRALDLADAAGAAEAFLMEDMDQIAPGASRNDLVAVRVYAHEVRPQRVPGERIDFTETLYWNAGLKTNEEGTATIEFGLSDAVTSFRVFAEGFDASGSIAASETTIESVQPFYLEPRLPLEVTAGDQLLVPLGVVNASGTELPVRLSITSGEALALGESEMEFSIGDERLRRLLAIAIGNQAGDAPLTLDATAGAYGDKVTRNVRVVPRGFPIEVGQGGLVNAGDTMTHEISIPADMIGGSLLAEVKVYPTPLSSMTSAMERLIQEPYGCFEQTSSSTYPLVMAQQYFMSHQGVDPSLVSRSGEMLVKGYDRLTSFETSGGGYEWFGEDPGHEALTAYGLLEFSDMSQVSPVDSAMVERTREWLLTRRDGEGGFKRERRALHTWIEDAECSNAYIVWALLSAGIDTDLSEEVAWVRHAAENTDNTYVMALGANVMALAGDEDGLNHLLDKMGGLQEDNGSLSGATTSIVGSGGEALEIETTALAVMAWLTHPAYAQNVERSIQYLAESCKAGRYGSTQSTVLALRAIVAYDASRARPQAPGSLVLLVDDAPVGEPVKFDVDQQGVMELPDCSALLAIPGEHKVQLQMEGGSQMPYTLTVNYFSEEPASSAECALHLEAALVDTEITEGEVTEARVAVINRTNEAVPNAMAIIGIPGGLEVRHDQLKELVDAKRIAAYEVIGREVVLYWRSLAAEERVDLPLSLVAAVPGSYTGPASRAYLYYTDEYKDWNPGLAVEIAPRDQ